MPKKPELSFEAKQIIWDIAATYSSRNYSAILRDVDKKFEELRKEGKLFDATPDLRTLKNIIEIEEKLSKAKSNAKYLDDHYNVLSTTALRIADLVYYVGTDIGEQTIRQIVDKLGTWKGGDDPPAGQLEQHEELSDLLVSTEAKWLLSHLKSEAPMLFIHIMYAHPEYFTSVPYKKPKSKNIDRWEDMTQDDISEYGERLTDLLKLRAGRLDFEGTCAFCVGRK